MRGVQTMALVCGLLWGTLGGVAVGAEDLSGCWEGCWYSETTGHKGPLFATFTKLDDCHYQVDFSGRFFKIIPFKYSVVLNVVAAGETTQLSGQNYLGRRYGTFTYCAEATGCQFHASYTSCKDCGTFQLTRVCAATCP